SSHSAAQYCHTASQDHGNRHGKGWSYSKQERPFRPLLRCRRCLYLHFLCSDHRKISWRTVKIYRFTFPSYPSRSPFFSWKRQKLFCTDLQLSVICSHGQHLIQKDKLQTKNIHTVPEPESSA